MNVGEATATVPPAGEEGRARLRRDLEAVLMVVDQPVAVYDLARAFDLPVEEVEATLEELSREYTAQGRGFDLRQVAEGWRFYTRPECADVVEHFLRDGHEVRLTQAALETLAVVAYRQPVSRGRVSAVRGVNCDGVMRTLVLRGLIEEAGHDPESGALLYRTTTYFLERLGLRGLDELPDLAPFLPDDIEGLDDTGEYTT
ncbi:SMC-Scp complex subunit ScpB [Marinactinospora thermotolerans]|uniref:SMC-Scp complex subunit ScpB n=1 Tax=Marinactinospora thermotolerans TaxID=531310 RepID=UPI000999E05F|nr:SMC-Scp complex subunit ScpB [Marinactinospora thermotolerans]